MRRYTKRERRWKYVNCEKVNQALMKILEKKLEIKIKPKIKKGDE